MSTKFLAENFVYRLCKAPKATVGSKSSEYVLPQSLIPKKNTVFRQSASQSFPGPRSTHSKLCARC